MPNERSADEILGDCFNSAPAIESREPLLCVGIVFTATELAVVNWGAVSLDRRPGPQHRLFT